MADEKTKPAPLTKFTFIFEITEGGKFKENKTIEAEGGTINAAAEKATAALNAELQGKNSTWKFISGN